MLTNNVGAFREDEEDIIDNRKVTINTLQRTVLVERLCVDKYYPKYIIPYDTTNLYPNLVKSIALRSGSVMSSVRTLAKHTRGEGFLQMGIIVNRKGQTLWDILRFLAYQKAMFGGWALHYNFNIFGEISEIQTVPFEFVRWKKELDKLVVNPEWAKKRRGNDEKEYYPYNIKEIEKQIAESNGIENYCGQIQYWIPDSSDIYTVTDWDSVLDDAQFEAEVKIYGLSNIQNDYSLSGFFMYPKTLSSEKEIKEVKKDLKGDVGSKNAGGVKVLGVPPTSELASWKWFQSISRNNIDALFKSQVETAKLNIYAAFSQPPILNGVATRGMFNQESFIDAFNFYNAQTETERKDIERELNKIIQNSIWSSIGEIQIVPKKYENYGSITNKP